MRQQPHRNRIDVIIQLACLFLLISNMGLSQHRWDGEGNDSLWTNPVNWVTNTLPGVEEEVLLDNSVVEGNYVVKLPGGAVTVLIRRLTIVPGEDDSITLLLPRENIAVPGLQINSTGYGLTLHDRAVFINASGAASGLPVLIDDSIRINNGGRYIHRTGRSHAANISVLSTAPGTESGIFEFDIPGAAATISLSDRVFGKLVFSAVAAGRTVNYTAAGTNAIRVRSDIVLYASVQLNLNFSDTFFIERDFIQYASTFNCGTTARSLVIWIKGNLMQFSGGSITETGTGLPVLLLRGSGVQLLRSEGSISNSVTMTVATADCRLQSPVRLPFALNLVKGRVYTSDSTLLILAPACTIRADSIAGESFIDGPLQKEGLLNEHFLFPVGKGVLMRWLALKNVTGTVRVEFVKVNPQVLGNLLDTGLHHISSLEYWKTSEHLLTGANVELSFDNVNSGGVTELSSLRVAVFSTGQWENAGNSSTTGNAGASGSVVSNSIGVLGAGDRYFTLAAASGFHNPLPVFKVEASVVRENGYHLLRWNILSNERPVFFEIEGSVDGRRFLKIGSVPYARDQFHYNLKDGNRNNVFYRIRTIIYPVQTYLSAVVRLPGIEPVEMEVYPSIAGDQLQIRISRNGSGGMQEALIISSSGTTVKKIMIPVNNTPNHFTLNVAALPAGVYYLMIGRKARKFIKR